MNNQINDGGPAFPVPVDNDCDCHGRFTSGYGGMTLRDYFAAAALQGMKLDGEFTYQTYAGDAYLIADAMLKAKEAKP